MQYTDKKTGRMVDESAIRSEFEFYINEPWFMESYEKFRDKNFLLVKEDDKIVIVKAKEDVSRVA